MFSKNSCLNCQWGILELSGYSDVTVEDEEFTCLEKKRNFSLSSGSWKKNLEFAEQCSKFRKGGCIMKYVEESYEDVLLELSEELKPYFERYIEQG